MIDTKLYELIDEAKMKVLSTGRNITIVINHRGYYNRHIDITPETTDMVITNNDESLKKVTSYQIKHATNKDLIYIELT